VAPEAGLAFLCAQGDVWDAQKDMVLAGLGSIVTMLITFPDRAAYRSGRPPRAARQPAHPGRRPTDRRAADPALVRDRRRQL
jgi:predicted membrane protein DUF2238